MAMGPNYPGVAAFSAAHGVNAGITVTANTTQANKAMEELGANTRRRLNGIASSVSKAGKSLSDFDLHVRRINGNIVALGFAFYGVASKVEDFVSRGAKMELFQKRMEGVSGSVVDAQKDMAAIITMAQNVPFKLEAVTRAFIKLKSAGIEPITDKQGNGPLKAMIDAMAAFGGDSEQLDRAIIAITQMAGKGTVSMEELRQQLGESIPTAMRIAAREMHMTVSQFIKDVSRGKISWEQFAKVFFAGLEKNYAGRAKALMNTFTGSLAQLDTQFDILAKTVFVDTNTMRYFTAAVQVATDKMKELDAFLRTKKGQDWIKSLWEDFKQVVLYASSAEKPIRAVIDSIKAIGSAVGGVTGSLPPAAVTGGLMSYVLFGKAGILPGALVGYFSDGISRAANAVQKFIKDVDGYFESSAPGTIAGGAAIGGYLGYRIAGPYGALAGAIGGALKAAMPSINSFIDKIDELTMPVPEFDPQHKLKGNDSQALYDSVVAEWEHAKQDIYNKLHGLTLEVPVKVDLPPDLMGKSLLDEITAKTDTVKDVLVQKLEEISLETTKASARINSSIGTNQIHFVNKDQAVAELTDYQTEIVKKIDEINKAIDAQTTKSNEAIRTGGIHSPIAQGYEEDLVKLKALLSDTEKLYQETGSRIQQIKMTPDVAQGINDDLVSLKNYAATYDTSFESVESARAKLAAFSEGLAEHKKQLDSSNLSAQQKIELDNAMTATQAELADMVDRVNQKEKDSANSVTFNAKATAEVTKEVDKLAIAGRRLSLGESMTGEAERIQGAKDKIVAYLDEIAVEIEKIKAEQQSGLISPEVANAAIANLQAMANAAQGASGTMIHAATDVGQAWTDMGKSIYSAIETSLGDAIYGLVTGTKSLKDVLLDLWQSVTKAVSQYIAKLIMASLFGGVGGGATGGGGLFSGLFGGNLGGQLSFAGGGSFMQDGRTGFDKNLVSMRVSRGERVTVETPAQQNANSRQGGGKIYNIYALDGHSVERILMQHGAVVQRAYNNRVRLNHQ